MSLELGMTRWWLMFCPIRKKNNRSAEEPNEFELNSIRNDLDKLSAIRKRLTAVIVPMGSASKPWVDTRYH